MAIFLYFTIFLNILYKIMQLTIKFFMIPLKSLKIIFIIVIFSTLLSSCGGKFPGADARKYDPDPKKRVAKI